MGVRDLGRFFAAAVLGLMLLPAPGGCVRQAEPLFFSMLFPQLIPDCLLEENEICGRAVQL